MAAPPTLEERLSQLETRMTALEQLPTRMDGLDQRMDRLEHRIGQLAVQLQTEIRAFDESLRAEIRTGHVMIVASLTEQIEESRRHSRVLFEEALSRISSIQEHLSARRPKKNS